MQTRNFFPFGMDFNVLTSSVFAQQPKIESFSTDNDYFQLLDGSHFKLLDGSNFLLLENN